MQAIFFFFFSSFYLAVSKKHSFYLAVRPKKRKIVRHSEDWSGQAGGRDGGGSRHAVHVAVIYVSAEALGLRHSRAHDAMAGDTRKRLARVHFKVE